jgi:hypothetical protein
VKLIIYDVLGKIVATHIPPLGGGQEGLEPGAYKISWNASNFPSGIYFLKMVTKDSYGESESFISTIKMLLIK